MTAILDADGAERRIPWVASLMGWFGAILALSALRALFYCWPNQPGWTRIPTSWMPQWMCCA